MWQAGRAACCYLTLPPHVCRDSVILVLETGYVFGWLVAMVLNLIVPYETGDPMERIRAARKAKGLIVPLSEEEGRAIEENQIANPKMGFEGDSAHPQPVVVPVSLLTTLALDTVAKSLLQIAATFCYHCCSSLLYCNNNILNDLQ